MHSRNPYRIPPDFTELASCYERLKQYLLSDPSTSRTTIDFQDEDAQRRLTEAIMHRDFGITLNVPSTRLCPPVPNRLNYALWIQDIVRAHENVLGSHSRTRTVHGIDIGTGSTAIYPFLICKLEPTWDMVATEIDNESYECAINNVSQNHLQSRIHVEKASREGLIFFPLEKERVVDFTMCNPPFYGSADEVTQSAREKELPPNAVCTGADIEMIYPEGGEEGFVGRMLDESEKFQMRCKWYTSMLGKMSSVITIVKKLRRRSIMNYAITEFVQGQTRRWAIAWSFTDTRLPDSVARIQSINSKYALYSCMPSRNTLAQPFPEHTAQTVHAQLGETLQGIDGVLCTTIESETPAADAGASESLDLFFIEARENTWSRTARRNRAKIHNSIPGSLLFKEGNDAHSSSTASEPALTCSCRVVSDDSDDGRPVCVIEVQWIFGKDRSLFESFVGHVGRKVGAVLRSRDNV